MASTLHVEGETLVVAIGGLDSEEFSHALNIVKSIPGRRFDGETKNWVFPADYMTAMKLMNMLGPRPSPAAVAWLGEAKREAAENVRTRLPHDCDLTIEWAEKLYNFQRSGVDFLADHPHAILADDMGCGKTIESIATVYERSQRAGRWCGPVLVICPNAMRGTWRDEIVKWNDIARPSVTPAPEPVIINGKKPVVRQKELARGHNAGWVIVNWEKLRIMPELATYTWGAVIADEAHRAKSRKAKQTQALWKLRAEIQIAATGTPIMNSPDELWSLLKWLYPKVYTSYWRFYNEYCEYVEVHFGIRKGRVVTGVKNVDALRFELADKLVRRTKREVLPDLPEKLPAQIIVVDMKVKQRKLYDKCERDLWVEIEGAARDPNSDGSLDDALRERNLLLLPNAAARTTRLRQVSSTPALLGGPDESGKLDAIVEYITDSDDGERKWVVFVEFTDAADILCRRLEKRHIDAAAYHGKVKDATREGLKHAFQNEPDPRVLVCTAETGGVGLTLTAADTAIFESEDWVPALNDQATDRLHRIGQSSEVHVIVFRSADSVDTKRVAPTLARKDRIVGSVIQQDRQEVIT